MADLWTRFARDESGATAIEYSLIAGMIALALIASMNTLNTNMSSKWQEIADGFPK